MSTHVQKQHLDKLRQLLLVYTKNTDVKILLFGSHAKGNSRRYSDIDIALLPSHQLSPRFISDLKEKIEQSNIPYSVDLINLSECDDTFRQKVLAEGIVWKD